MIEFLLGTAAASAAAGGWALIRKARRYDGGWDDQALHRINEVRGAAPAPSSYHPAETTSWYGQTYTRAGLRIDPDPNLPQGVDAPPPKYEGPRG